MSGLLSKEWFDECFVDTPAPADIRRISERICRSYGIRGICDPAYIANVIAFELGRGDGQNHFTDTHADAERCLELANNHLEKLYDNQSKCHNIGHEYQQYSAKITTCETLVGVIRREFNL